MSMDEEFKNTEQYAESDDKISYEPYRFDWAQPEWKDTRHIHKRAALKDFGTERHRDKDVYLSREIAEEEWEKLFAKTWHFVGHMNDIHKENRFKKVEIGHESIIVTRGKGDKINAFYNVCQHRGATLVESDFGSAKKLVCPFHKWEYGMDGSLKKIIDRETFREKALCHDLNVPQVRAESWRGFIFINMDPDAMPLKDWIGAELDQLLSAYDFEKSVRVREVVMEWPVNWKLAHQAFNEGYHVQATHPQFFPAVNAYHVQHDLYPNGHGRSIYNFMMPTPHLKEVPQDLAVEHKIFLREAGLTEENFPKTYAEVPMAIINAKKARKNYAIDYSKFSEGQLIDDWGVGFFPSTETFLHPEGWFIQHWRPHPSGDPLKCIYSAQVYAVPGVGELPSFTGVQGKVNPDLDKQPGIVYLDTDDLEGLGPVISQDREVTPRTGRGVKSRGFKGAVYSDQEIRIRYWFDEYYKYMRGHKP